MLFHETDFVKIYWDEAPQCVRTEWHGFVQDDDLKESLTTALTLAESKNSSRWLSDLRDIFVYTPEQQEWLTRQFYPKLKAIGIKKFAVLNPSKAVAKMSIQHIFKSFEYSGLQIQFFDELEPAYVWLIS